MKEKFFLKILLVSVFFFSTVSTSYAAFGFIKRGFKHCTGTCDQMNICSIENDEQYRWCVKNCSHKMKVAENCEKVIPEKLRPLLPFEAMSGPYSTNEVSPFALQGLDLSFIKQTTDKKRLIGTAKKVLLVREQYLKNVNIQKLSEQERAKLAERLFLDYFKGATNILEEYKNTKMIPDDKLNILFKELRSELLAKWNKEKRNIH